MWSLSSSQASPTSAIHGRVASGVGQAPSPHFICAVKFGARPGL